MSEMNMEDAARALAEANKGDESANSPTPQPNVNPPDEGVQSAPQETPTETESFTSVSLDDLSDEQRAVVETRLRDMQGDYTRKTQELASQRAEAEQAIEFVQALQTNPDFALQVRDEISNALEATGYSPAEAQAEANRQVASAATDDGSAFGEEPDPIQAEIAELKAWREDQEQRQMQFELENELDRMDARIRQDNPRWTDDDMQDVYRLAYSTGGNLVEAADAYRALQQRLVGGYVDTKTGVQTSEPSATGSAQAPPEKFESLLDPRLAEAAKRMLLEAGED